MKKILFVCTGNTCRSPMAEYIMNGLLSENGLSEEYSASSAGVSTADGLCASSGSVKACKMTGTDISGHKSRMITGDILRDADIVLCMGQSHKYMLEMYYPGMCGEKVYTLGEFASLCDGNVNGEDVPDPYMMGDEVYMAVREVIAAYLEVIINYLKGIKK